ncbi:MAG: homoserine kinase [Firmicutes bacterium]|nr:homoserine kinase [Bacillota bacterium]
MIKITLPATTANFGIGFDTLGMSLDLYNVFTFKQSDAHRTIGFDENIKSHENLVLSSYILFAEAYQKKSEILFVEIEQLESQIPVSRGLGSSAACILAGVFGANIMNELGKTYEECVDFAAKIEGHPDNVFACAYGGFISAYLENENYYYDQYPISKSIQFQLLIPLVTGNTSLLRKVLPTSLSYQDTVHNLSRIISLPNALQDGDFLKLKRILKDQLHEPYRFPFIPQSSLIQELNQQPNLIALISGSGPTVLLLHLDSEVPFIVQDILDTFELVEIKIGNKLETEVLK